MGAVVAVNIAGAGGGLQNFVFGTAGMVDGEVMLVSTKICSWGERNFYSYRSNHSTNFFAMEFGGTTNIVCGGVRDDYLDL